MSTNYGIDYSGGSANVNAETGIHYGVIPLNCLGEFAIEEFEPDYGEPTCPNCGNEVEQYNDKTRSKYEKLILFTCENCKQNYYSEECFGDEPVSRTLENTQYTAPLDSDGDIFITRSPYYTHAQFCSPCAPGACHLGNPVDSSGPKAYCFGHDWFDGEKAPYPVYSVKDGSLVEPE